MKETKLKQEEAEIGFAEIGGIVLTFVVIGIVSAIGLNIITTTKASFNTDNNATTLTVEENETADTIRGIGNITTQLPLMGLAIGGAAILTVVLGVFAISKLR